MANTVYSKEYMIFEVIKIYSTMDYMPVPGHIYVLPITVRKETYGQMH